MEIEDILKEIEPERPISDSDKDFNVAAQAYVDLFGYFPSGPSMPDLTTQLLENAVKNKREIFPNIPDDVQT